MYIELHAGKIRGDPEYAGFNATVKLKGEISMVWNIAL